LILFKFKDRLAHAHLAEKLVSVKRASRWISHPNFLWHRAKLASGGSTTLSVTEISQGQRGDIGSMRPGPSGTLLHIAHLPGIFFGQINEVFCMEQQ
jgi:hypothetical protein